HVQSLRYRNLVVAKVDSEFFRTVPAHITILHISQSFILKSISVPGRTNLSELILSDLNELHKLEIDETNTIAELSVTVSKLAAIPQSIDNLKAAHKITFTNCPIEVLNLEMFCDLSKLRVLNFNENRIHRLFNSATKRCTLYDSLQMFSISRNLMKQFHLALFNPFGSLQLLEVKHNGMMSVRDGFSSVAYLSLALTKNKLKTLDLCKWNVPNMIILKLDYNNLSTIPTCLENLVNVTVLNLAHNQVTHATIQNFAQMKRLRELVLSFNSLTTFTLNSSEYPASLETVELESNNLTELDLSFIPGGTNISELILADNEVNKLVIDEYNTIAELTVSVSKLAAIPQSIGNLKAALTIAITSCPIETLNIEMFCDLSKLQILNLEANRIRNIVNSATTNCSLYESLKTLSISQNMLKQLNLDPFNHLAKLQRLNAKHNGMISARGDFNSEAHLRLCLSKNQLKALDLCRWHVPNMVYLELDYNNLTTIPTCLENLPNVTLLSLSRNQIKHVTIQSFARMSHIEGLDLSYNNLTTIMLNSSQYPATFKCIWLMNNNLTELNLSVVTVPSLEVYVHTNCISKVDMEQISPNVTKLDMWNNPFDCSWQKVDER
uniref:Uncharacterized protein n=1 Tax=Anopheles quadriannulatus TaxID=34691 RepID=A0A182X0G1_ANOQN